MMIYKGYAARVDYDESAETFYGTVVNANVLISFRGRTVEELKKSIADVVETYLEECRTRGEEPEKSYNGRITVRVDPAVHRHVAMKAAACNESMNEYVERLLERETADQDTRCAS